MKKSAIGAALRFSLAVAAPAFPLQAAGAREAAACDSACLDGFVDRYIEAVLKQDVGKLPLAPKVKFAENNVVLPLGGGSQGTITRFNRDYAIRAADPQTGQVGYAGAVWTGDRATMFALRLKVERGQITEIETIVPGASLPAQFADATAKLTHSRPIFDAVEPLAYQSGREQLRDIANSYYEGLEQEDSRPVPFSRNCHRIENGLALTNNPDFDYGYVATGGREKLPNLAALGCMDLANSGAFNADMINARRFPIIDQERGVVFAFTFYQGMVKDSCAQSDRYGKICLKGEFGTPKLTPVMLEIFKVRDRKIEAMESVWALQARTWRSVWWSMP